MNAINSGGPSAPQGRPIRGQSIPEQAEPLAAQDGPPVRTGGVHGWEPGQRVHFAGRDWDILAISDNGLYVGRTWGGVAFDVQYLNLSNVTVQPAKWAK